MNREELVDYAKITKFSKKELLELAGSFMFFFNKCQVYKIVQYDYENDQWHREVTFKIKEGEHEPKRN